MTKDQPVAPPASAQGRGRGRGDSGRGFGQRGATQAETRGPTTGQVFPIDLLELLFWAFDVIIGMDWLIEHRVKVDYEAKLMNLYCPDDSENVVVGERFKLLSNVVSVLRVEKLVRKGCEAYLAYVLNANSKELRLDEIRAIYDFLDAFLEELRGIRPGKEVEFGIKLYRSTAPVSIALYRMAPKELKELKLQL
ncbi:Gag protease polyprotein [Gossypium australe]|uniref:Gag protease polyprotein n=1 Tax=Gossypium australe TaxID=47621 RepID=A0A5B6VNN0_9ROSI|nr:Gag protease polyprotein [Gossypium australe]